MATLTTKIISGRRLIKINNLYVEVWKKNTINDRLLGATLTSTDGTFSITYEASDVIPIPGTAGFLVYVRIYQNDQLLHTTIKNPVVIQRDRIPNITLISDQSRALSTNLVKGVIAMPKGRGIANLIVRGYNKTTRAEVFLSEGITNGKGEYLIYYQQNDSIRSDTSIDLIIKAYRGIRETTPVIVSPLIVNALPEEIINLSVGDEVYQGLDLYTSIHETLEGSINPTSLIDLSARDVLILANTNELAADDVSYYVQARQWAAQWEGLPEEVYFGWFKTSLPTNWIELLNTPVETLISGIEEAIRENFIPVTTERQKQGLEGKIKQWRTDNLITAKGERVERASIGELLGTSGLNKDQQVQLLDGWQNFEGGVDEFWKQQQEKLGADSYNNLELTLQLGAVSRSHLPLIQSVKNKTRIKRVQDIAAFHEEDWLRMMEEDNMEVPEDIPGKDLKSKRKEYAAQLRGITEELVPTAVLASSFRADEEVDSQTLDRFMDRNPEFEFRTKSVRTYLKENPEALGDVEDKDAVQRELEAVQRIFHITPTRDKYKVAKVLWKNQLHSAYAIKMGGLSTLKTLFNGNEELAESIFNRASMKHNQSKMLKMQLQSLSTPVYALFPGLNELLQALDDSADLEALFGDQGYCNCKHCDSFFSPSAYLVDLFLYLNKVKISGSASPDQDTALEKLFKRRPDLGNIQLDCENAHTPLPYIDLVNEVMEMAIAPTVYQNQEVKILGKTFTLPVAKVPQTERDPSTLKAYPQFIKQEAYDILRAGENNQTIGFPWILPFNLWMLEMRTYLNHLGVSRADLMESILGGAISNEAIAAEYLNILPEEQIILNDTEANASTTLQYWGTSTSQLGKVPVFLKQTGYSYEKLTKLLRMRYIQPAQSIVFNPPSSCSVSDASLPDITHKALSRMHKFGRLLLKTNENMHSLDRTIMAFGGDINSGCLINYSDLLRVEKFLKAKIDRKELLSWWALLDREDYQADTSLYTKLFMTPEEINAFKLNDTKDELLAPGVIIDPKAPPLDPDLLAIILSATRLKAKDLELLVTEEFPDGVINFNLSQLSYLYRTASFCRAQKLKVTEYLALKNVLGFQPITSIDQLVTPGQTLAFLKKFNSIKEAGLEPETLNYILRNHSRSKAPYAITDPEIEKILKLLHGVVRTQLNEVFPAGTTTREIAEAKLKIIIGTNEAEEVEKVLIVQNIIAGNSTLSVQEQEGIIDQLMVFFLDKQDAKNQLSSGGLTNTDARLGAFPFFCKFI